MGNKKNKKEIEQMQIKHETLTEKEKGKIFILVLISILLAGITEFIFVSSGNAFSIPRSITLCGIYIFIGLHFVIGFKKLYTIIVENRFKISFVMIVLSTFIGYLRSNIGIQEWLLNTSTTLSLWWNLKFYGLLLVTYELFKVITDESQGMSIIGTIVVVFSGAVQWNFNKIDSLIWGELIVVLLNKLLNQENSKNKIWYVIGMMISIVAYAFTFTGYAISFGYVFIALIIWILIKNRKALKNNGGLLVGATVISIVCAVILRMKIPFNYNDVIENETRGLSILYSYLYNILLPFNNLGEETALFGSFLSAFPVPMLIALYYMYKNDDHIEFLLPIIIVSVLETVFCMSGLPDTINKITLFSNVSLSRGVAGVSLASVYIMFYMIKHIDKKLFSVTSAMRIVVLLMLVIGFIGYPQAFRTVNYMMLFMIEACLISFLFLIFHDENYKKTLLFFLCIIALIGGITVNPIILI